MGLNIKKVFTFEIFLQMHMFKTTDLFFFFKKKEMGWHMNEIWKQKQGQYEKYLSSAIKIVITGHQWPEIISIS